MSPDRTRALPARRLQGLSGCLGSVGADLGLYPGFAEVMTRVRQVAPTDTPVLLLGEPGTGQEAVSRAIHEASRRAHAPLVRVTCGAIAASRLAVELFGRDAEDSAREQSGGGSVERADGGTLFLDEVEAVSPTVQIRVLRLLDDGFLERVGGHRPIPADVRFVASSHRNLQDLVATGVFREDLWYRMGVFPIRLPPLRERRQDIPGLVAHLVEQSRQRFGGRDLVLSRADAKLLAEHEWPGNLWELTAVVERAILLGNGRQLEVARALAFAGPGRPRSRNREASWIHEIPRRGP